MSKWLPVAAAATSNCTLINARCRSHLTWHVSLSRRRLASENRWSEMTSKSQNKPEDFRKKRCSHCLGVVGSVGVRAAPIGEEIKWGVNLKLGGGWLYRLMSGTWRATSKETETWGKVAKKREGGWQEGTTARWGSGKRKNQCVTIIWLLGKNSTVANCCCCCFCDVVFVLVVFASLSCQRRPQSPSGSSHLSSNPPWILTHASIHAEASMILTPIRSARAGERRRQVTREEEVGL